LRKITKFFTKKLLKYVIIGIMGDKEGGAS